ncbi:DUF1433 domain-containing protein [Sporolactobacillus shoreae]|uniref:DUF1433 domain-containing protein n=1 Tax=Sporolactobacillus shoreae TaxID=1465501 RepID=A0A4Z0GKG0_9BACL|nr:DUF1433 domain-containing protein [Sporolactobacillus shoreae]TGA96574.1 DUF1433 domain-containing protein [Sporolactobacillus shoreae]
MKQKTYILIILSSLLILATVVSGYFWMQQAEKQAFITKQESRITEYLKYNVPSCKTITFTDNYKLPTGSISIDGYLNNNKILGFTMTVSLAGGETDFEGVGGYTDELDKLFRKDVKTVSQIEKIEKEQKENSKSE